MFYTYEFEVFESDGLLVAVPYDMDGGTQGEDWEDLGDMVSDWLRGEINYRLMQGKGLPPRTFGNSPRKGGTNIVVSVQAGLDTVERVTAADAARMLGVTPGRVSQMLSTGQLVGWRDGHSSYVTRDSLEARMKAGSKVGRPRASACEAASVRPS